MARTQTLSLTMLGMILLNNVEIQAQFQCNLIDVFTRRVAYILYNNNGSSYLKRITPAHRHDIIYNEYYESLGLR